MQANTKTRTICLLAALALLSLMVGCRVPGSSFASDPLHLRFAKATQMSMVAAETVEVDGVTKPTKSAQVESIVLAGHVTR